MASTVDQARKLIGFNEWSNSRILAAAEKLTPDHFGGLARQFEHVLSAQGWWMANWSGGKYSHVSLKTIDETKAAYAVSHAGLRAFATSLTDEVLDRTGDWFGNGKMLTVADSIVQVVNHSTQHRSEIAVTLTEHDASPGDLDYVFFVWAEG